jgi:iron complex outermembrane recepter protein
MTQFAPTHPFNRSLISLAAASVCAALAWPAAAQQAPAAPPPPADATAQVVEISGIRASLARAAELKREVTGIRDSIVAEDIGKLPEQNIADALAQLPGVEVIKDPISNEGQSVRLRGLGVNQTITSINGAMVRTTSTGKIGGGFREFSYDVLPSELFKQVDIYKTPLAELQEGGIGGNIDLQTPRPFDRKGFVGRYALTAVNNTNDGKTNPRGNIFVSNTWGNFGALISVAASRANNGNAGALNSTGQWITSEYGNQNNGNRIAWNTTTASGTGGLSLAQLNSGFMPRLIRIFSQESQRERVGVNTSLQYKTDRLDISYDAMFAKINDDQKDYFVAWSNGDSTGAGRALVPINVRLDANNNLAGTIGNYVQNTFSRTFLNESKFQYHGFNGNYKLNDTTRLKGQLAFSKGDAWRNDALLTASGDTTTAARQTLTVDFANPLAPKVSSNVSLLDPNTFTAFAYGGGYRTEKDEQNFLNLVGERDWSFGDIFGVVKAGVNYAQSTKGVTNFNAPNVLNNYLIPGLNKTFANATAAERIAFMRPILVPNDASAVSRTAEPGVPSSWMIVPKDFVYGTLDALGQNKAGTKVPNTSYESTETTSAFFVQTDLETDVLDRKLKANVGVRVVETKTDSDTVTQALGGGWVPINPKSTYNNTLPAVSVSYDLTPKLVARAAYGETITRGPINRIAGAVRIPNPALLGVELGNPALLPEKSKGTDFALEFYPNRRSVVAANVFERKISGSAVTTTSDRPFSSLGLDPLLWQPTQAALLAATPSTPIAVTTFTNSPDSYKVKGYELQYSQTFTFLPAPFDGLGATASFTKVDVAGRNKSIALSSKDANGNLVRGPVTALDPTGGILFTNQTFNMPNLPPQTISLAGFYEKGPYSLRVAYTKRDAFANDGSNDSNGIGFQRWFNERAYTNLAAGYKINKMFELRFDVLNLTKTKTFEYFKNYDPNLAAQRGNDESRIENGWQSGRTYQLTLRGSF